MESICRCSAGLVICLLLALLLHLRCWFVDYLGHCCAVCTSILGALHCTLFCRFSLCLNVCDRCISHSIREAHHLWGGSTIGLRLRHLRCVVWNFFLVCLGGWCYCLLRSSIVARFCVLVGRSATLPTAFAASDFSIFAASSDA